MTFYEAALSVLEREGKPLHFKAITEKAITEKLLSHVGKDPEVTMFHRLSAMARRKGDRKVVATEPGTFGLLDWGVIEDPAALDATVLPVPDDKEIPLRPRERHPAPSRDNVRVSGRGGDRGRKGREEREGREGRRRLQPLPELCFEALSRRTEPITALELAASLRDQEKVNEDLGADALLNALREDNRRRQAHDRRPLFIIGANGELTLDRAGAPGEGVPVDLQAAFAQALGVPLESKGVGGPERGRPERMGPGAQRLASQAREHQRNIGRVVRRRFGELELGAAELIAQALLESHGFKDVRVAKRTRESATFTCRKRDGLLDAKFAVRVFKGNREVGRQDVADLRKDLVSYIAQVGVVFAAGEVGREARSEAIAAGPLMLLWCGEALADKLLEKKVGTTSITIEVPDLDEAFFRRARDQGEVEDRKREERRLEREAAEQQDRARRASGSETAEAAPGGSESVGDSSTPVTPSEGSPSTAAQEPSPGPSSDVGVIEVRVDLSQPPRPEPEHSPEAMATAMSSASDAAPKVQVEPPAEGAGAPKLSGEGGAA